MAFGSEFSPTGDDVTWAYQFKALNLLLSQCDNAAKATLLLSTCRNAYMTVNALFTELQVLMGDAIDPSALRGGCELLMQRELDISKIRERFARAIQTIREFELKRQVWNEREIIWKEVERAKKVVAESDKLAPSAIDLILKQTRIPDEGMGDGFDHELLSIDLQDRPHLNSHFEALDRNIGVLRYAAELGFGVARCLEQDDPQAQLVFADGIDEKHNEVRWCDRVVKSARDLVEACGWIISGNDEGAIVDISDNYIRPRTSSAVESLVLPSSTAPEAIAAAAHDLGVLIRESLYLVHGELSRAFKPNVARLPMPTLFSVALPMPIPTPHSGVAALSRVVRVRCSSVDEPSDSIRIGLAGLVLPFSKLNGQTYRIEEAAQKVVARDIRLAVQEAKESKCAVLVFPEYSIPRSIIPELKKLSDSRGIVIIGGLEGKWVQGQLYDEAAVIIPNEKQVHFQAKQEPSLEEEAGDGFYRDGEFRLFTNSPIGSFSVVVCSDFLQLSTLQVWKSDAELPETLFVIARNKYHELYSSFARADAVRMYSCVVVSNVYDGDNEATTDGSCVIVPARDNMSISGQVREVAGTYVKNLSVHDVSLRAIRARSRGKPENGYLAVPKSAQRT